MAELSGLTLTVIKLGFLAVLWVFVLTAVSVMRSDLFGTRVTKAAAPAGKAAKQPRPAKAPKPTKSAKPRKGAPSSLIVTQGPLTGTALRLSDAPVTVGRANDCTLVLTDDYASSRHARFFTDNGQWYVEDLGSTNGTYLDRTKLSGPTPAPVGVPIRIGKTVVELRK
jgi:hypothetical protein